MERRTSTLLFAAIVLACAALGMFDGSPGPLTLTPFLLLALPLLFGLDPASPTVDRLLGLLALPRLPRPSRPHLRFLTVDRTGAGRDDQPALGSRGPPLSYVGL